MRDYTKLTDQDPDRAASQRVDGVEIAAILLWALLASGQIANRKTGGWRNLVETLTIDLFA